MKITKLVTKYAQTEKDTVYVAQEEMGFACSQVKVVCLMFVFCMGYQTGTYNKPFILFLYFITLNSLVMRIMTDDY